MPPAPDPSALENAAARALALREALGRRHLGDEAAVELLVAALLADGHVLIEGAPGLGKTRLVRTLAELLDLRFGRVQCTPDLMPADVTGGEVLDERGGERGFRFVPGPVFCQVLLADEINRATPRTQSALLEAMEERQVTSGGATHALPEPFFLCATQNPVELEGTYPLPEAQLDRFLMKLLVDYPEEHEYRTILERTTGTVEAELEAVCHGPEILALREVVRAVPVPEAAMTHAVRLVMATQPGRDGSPALVDENVALGSSPRGAQALLLCAKVRALLGGRFAVSCDDVRQVAPACLRHRVMINFHGMAEGVTPDQVVAAVLAAVAPQE